MLLSEILPAVAKRHPDAPAILAGPVSMTYAGLHDKVSRLANSFYSLGVSAGDRIALVGESYHMIIAEHAAVAIGAIPFAVNMRLQTPEAMAVLLDADPIVCVCDENGVERIQSLTLPGVRFVISCTKVTEYLSFDDLIHSNHPLEHWHQGEMDDAALMIYTGGTTGRPRGVVHSHRSITQWTFMNPERRLGVTPGNMALVFNFQHITGQSMIWMNTITASCLVVSDTYPMAATDVLRMVDVHRLQVLGFTGQLLRDFVCLPDLVTHDLSCVNLVVHGGSPASRDTLMRATQVFPRAAVAEAYGTTETGLYVCAHFVQPWTVHEQLEGRLDSVGSAAFLATVGQVPYEVQVMDATGRTLAPREIGEVVCRGGLMMKGYWRDQNATDETIQNGWLHTGDLGFLDEEGYLYLLSRRKDLIIVNGLNVYSIEVENTLARHESIEDAAVVSAPLPGEGEEVAAVVKVKHGHTVTLEMIQNFCRQHIAEYKIPTRLHFVDALPRTSLDKPDKVVIRKWFWGESVRQVN